LNAEDFLLALALAGALGFVVGMVLDWVLGDEEEE